MRHRDPHDDPPAKRRPARYVGPPVKLGHIRPHGVRHLLLLDMCRKAVCTKCGVVGADVRPNWSERPPPKSLTGAQWR
jgi:hypothetical protein